MGEIDEDLAVWQEERLSDLGQGDLDKELDESSSHKQDVE